MRTTVMHIEYFKAHSHEICNWSWLNSNNLLKKFQKIYYVLDIRKTVAFYYFFHRQNKNGEKKCIKPK